MKNKYNELTIGNNKSNQLEHIRELLKIKEQEVTIEQAKISLLEAIQE